MTELYVGLMSGTSQDGLDAALIELGETSCNLLAAKTTSFPTPLATTLGHMLRDPKIDVRDLGTAGTLFGEFAAESVYELLSGASCRASQVTAIGFSGHTIYHKPDPPHAFTLQVGNPNVIAARTGITTVADFRSMDVAEGGQGAPLLPAFHAWQFSDEKESRVAVNIGGIANVTCLVPGELTTGFDSGPGNTFMDYWCQRHGRGHYDRNGAWAKTGQVVTDLLRRFRADNYFQKAPPKSTGLEYFNESWLLKALETQPDIDPVDIQATLLELTAATITDGAKRARSTPKRMILCGGGAYNGALVERLRVLVAPTIVESSSAHGIAPEWVEAAGFAWLARARLAGLPGNVPSVTGAREAVQLGGVYSGRKHNA